MNKHTKGPWHFAAHARENGFEKTEVPFDYKGSGFCGNPSIYGADAEVVGCDEYYVFSNEADVRLICAAPDLLEACKSQHDAIYWLSKRLMELDKSFIPPESSIWPVLQASYAAIDKATGVNDE